MAGSLYSLLIIPAVFLTMAGLSPEIKPLNYKSLHLYDRIGSVSGNNEIVAEN